MVLLFAGWGMDERPFAGLARAGYDIAVVWDYRDISASWADRLAAYDEIAILAWSFGVPAASAFISAHPDLPVTSRIAVNGTQHPVDDRLGIPKSIFDGTLRGLDNRNMTKFYRRMCGNGESYKSFSSHLPQRDVDGLRDELAAIGSRAVTKVMWDKALIADNDLIIPTANQLRAWETQAFEITTYHGSHLPPFAEILSDGLTDKSLVEQRFRKASETYEQNASVQRAVSGRLIEMVPQGIDILEIGAGSGYATTRLSQGSHVTAWDLTLSPAVTRMAADGRIAAVACDAETAIMRLPDQSVPFIFSASTVQWFNSLPAFLRQVWRVLAPGGTALISTFGPRTMEEIHNTAGTSTGFPDTGSIKRMMPGAEVAEELITLRFPTPADALRHVRLTGVNSLGTTSPAATRRLLSSYPLNSDGTAPLTYHPVYITIKKPL